MIIIKIVKFNIKRKKMVTMISKFTCRNFRNVNAENLEFERINILIGPNNSGKSNFMKALTFFSDMLKFSDKGNLKSAFLNAIARNGWDHILNKNADRKEAVELAWEINLKNTPLEYKFNFTVGDNVKDCNIILEELNSVNNNSCNYDKEYNYFICHGKTIGKGFFSSATQKGRKNKRLTFNIDSKDTIIKNFKDILLENTNLYTNDRVRVEIATLFNNIKNYFEGFNVYSSSQFNTQKMREPVDIKNMDKVLARDASNFSNVFNNYKAQNIFWKDNFNNYLKELMPDIQTIDTVSYYDKLIFKLAYDGKEYDLADVSEGTLKALVLNLLINMSMQDVCPLLAIDEPENNLHPAWQKVIGQWIQLSDNFKQCFISTHSPDFLDVFTDEFIHGNVAVFVFDGNSEFGIKKIVYKNIKEDLGNWELGDLYRINDPALGGWPW